MLLALGLLAIFALDGRAQAAAQTQASAQTPPVAGRDVKLIFEREVYRYPAAGRRDPFRSLADEDNLGPLFDDLTLRMIIHSPLPNQSVVLLADGAKKVYRVRRGDIIGNATVVEISASRVVFTVDEFGNRRQEVMDMKPKNQKEGA
jgi:hypothetical protein